ncbi:carboxymuconolactone decarboxylase [Moniliophthora roreri]|nr:carboxymuconolactone decarboxylase [Moniliophthora roreri]
MGYPVVKDSLSIKSYSINAPAPSLNPPKVVFMTISSNIISLLVLRCSNPSPGPSGEHGLPTGNHLDTVAEPSSLIFAPKPDSSTPPLAARSIRDAHASLFPDGVRAEVSHDTMDRVRSGYLAPNARAVAPP